MLHGTRFTTYVCRAIIRHYDLKNNRQYCWVAKEGVLTRYSNDVLAFIKSKTQQEVNEAVTAYRAYLKEQDRPVPIRTCEG